MRKEPQKSSVDGPKNLQAKCDEDCPDLPGLFNAACDAVGLARQETLKRLARWFIAMDPEDRSQLFRDVEMYPLTPAGRAIYERYGRIHRHVLSAGLVAFMRLRTEDERLEALREATGQSAPDGLPPDMVIETVRREIDLVMHRPEKLMEWLRIARSAGLLPAASPNAKASKTGGEGPR
jgi:hypothetical protein